jgi:thiopurine S-methyltransferase
MAFVEAEFWHERWECGQTGWHQPHAHPTLIDRWNDIGAPPDADVFVPLCGRSVDMTWLAGQGHRVIGSELSELAIRGFFDDVGLEPVVRVVGSSSVFEAGPYQLWCGDFFDLPAAALTDVAATYDRASLVALPPEMRRRYAARLAELLPVGSVSLVLTFVYDPSEMQGPPFSVATDEVHSLFADRFDVSLVEVDDVVDLNPDLVARGVTALDEEIHVLRRRG